MEYTSNHAVGEKVPTEQGEGIITNVSFPNGAGTPPVYTIEVKVTLNDPLEG